MASKAPEQRQRQGEKSIKKMPIAGKKKVVSKKHVISSVDKTLHRSRNNSTMSKKSLRDNNRLLAKCLSRAKRENRILTNEIDMLVAERFELAQRYSHVRLKLKECKGLDSTHLEKITNLKIILNQLTGNILSSSELITNVVNLFKDVDVDTRLSGRSVESANSENTEQEQDSDVLGEKVANEENAVLSEIVNNSKENKSAVIDPKDIFDLTAILEQSESESRRSSVQRRSSINHRPPTKSMGSSDTAVRTRPSSRGSRNSLINVPEVSTVNSPATAARASGSVERKSLENHSELKSMGPSDTAVRTQSSSRRGSRDSLINVPEVSTVNSPATAARVGGSVERESLENLSELKSDTRINLQKQRCDELIELNHLSPRNVMRISTSKDRSSENDALRRGTFVVTNSLQIAPWSPVGPRDQYVSTRTSKSRSNAKQLPDVVNGTPRTSKGNAENLNNSDHLHNITHNRTSMEVVDMEFTVVQTVAIVDGRQQNEEENVSLPAKRPSMEIDRQPLEELNVNNAGKQNCNSAKRRRVSTQSTRSTTVNPTSSDLNFDKDDCYDTATIREESVKSLGKFNAWKSKQSSRTKAAFRLHDDDDNDDDGDDLDNDDDYTPPIKKTQVRKKVKKTSDDQVNKKKGEMVPAKTPKTKKTASRSEEPKRSSKKVVEPKKTPKKSVDLNKTPKRSVDGTTTTPTITSEPRKTPHNERDSTEKENYEDSGRPKRARKAIDYKLPGINTKIRRDKQGNVIMAKRVSFSSMTENRQSF